MNWGTSAQSGRTQAPGSAGEGARAVHTGTIEVHLRSLSQLFDALDPSPFREKDLDPNAEEYIVDSVGELHTRKPTALVIHLDEAPASAEESRIAGDAIRVHFARRARLLRRDLQRLLRRGVISLLIGLAFLAAFFGFSQIVVELLRDSPFATLLREGLLIVGWVAMWRPIEIFLYDWWPILGEQQVHQRLSQIDVQIVHHAENNVVP